MSVTEDRLKAKLPGPDTGIEEKNSLCDICAPGPHCGVTCAVKDGRILRVEGTADHPCNRGRLCTKGAALRQYVYRADRVLTPLRRTGERGEGKFEPIGWDEALDECAARLNAVKRDWGPDAAAFYSGYDKWYRPFLQRLCYDFGSVNYGTESSSCFTATILSWRCAAGVDAVAPDLKNAGVILGWCWNGYYSQYLMVPGMRQARARGAKLVLVDPRKTFAARDCDLLLRPRPGTDGALALGLGRLLIENGWIDRPYIEKNVLGFEQYAAYVRDFSPERVEELTGVPADDVRAAARLIGENGPLAVTQSGAALVHHRNGVQNHRAVMALTALRGSFGRPGGVLPVPLTYAHSMGGFVTGDHAFARAPYPQGHPRPVGCEKYPLWDKLVGEMQANDLAAQILTQKPYPVKALWAHGMNYRMFPGDGEFLKAFRALDFFVDVDLFLTDTARWADIVLPACSSVERSEFKVWQGGYAQLTEPVIAPLGSSRPDTDILFDLAERLKLPDATLRAGYDACLADILAGTGVELEELRRDRQHPHRTAAQPWAWRRETPSGKFELWSETIAALNAPGLDPLPVYTPPFPPDGRFPFTLVTGSRLPNALHSRCHDVPWLRSLRPEAAAQMHPEDMRALGLAPGDRATLRTDWGELSAPVRPDEGAARGCVFLYHGYREADANSLVSPEARDPYSGFPAYRSVPCAVEKERAV